MTDETASQGSARDNSKPTGENGSASAPASPAGSGRNERKVRLGVVVSDRMDKTVVVEVSRSLRHPLYGRTVAERKKYKAHDEHNECGVGDRVELMETRPLSKDKRWRVTRILEKAR